jgi:uncharacterized protein (TIGR03084 family)
MPLIEGLVRDLWAERRELETVLAELPDTAWSTATPAPGWTIHDQVAHLAHFDAVARLSVESPSDFERMREGIVNLQQFIDAIGSQNDYLDGTAKLAWWRDENDRLGRSALAGELSRRLPWFGPTMSLASMLTARIMETWAHGQDVIDALGFERRGTSRLQHVARLGVGTFAHSFLTRGRDVPAEPVAVVLEGVDSDGPWIWGDASSPNLVTGPVLDFCLVTTQRRHVDDTELVVRGTTARDWMLIAQAFAGPPGAGRRAGEPVRQQAFSPTPRTTYEVHP